MSENSSAITELGRLRNRHVAKILDYIGDTPPYLESAIKKSFSMFAIDIERNIINNSDNRGNYNDNSEANGNR